MALIITPEEIADALSISVTDEDVQIAQDVIELFTPLDLHSELPEDRFTEKDLRRLRLAVQWQAAYFAEHPEILTERSVESASANGASVKYAQWSDPLLAPMAARFLQQLTTAGGPLRVRTLRPTREDYLPQPDPWVLLSTGGRL